MRLFDVKDVFAPKQSLVESFQLAQKEFSQNNSPDEVKTTLDRFRSLNKMNKLKGTENDINHWRKQGFDKLQDYVSRIETTQTKTQLKKGKDPGDGVILVDNDTQKVVIPMDFKCSRFHGKDTDWCTTKPNTSNFSDYVLGEHNQVQTLIYVINKKAMDKQSDKFAIAFGKDEYYTEALKTIEDYEAYDDDSYNDRAHNKFNRRFYDDEEVDRGDDAYKEAIKYTDAIDKIGPNEQDENGSYHYSKNRELAYQMFNKKDDTITTAEFEEATGFKPETLIDAAQTHSTSIEAKRTNNRKTDPWLRLSMQLNQVRKTKQRDPELERELLRVKKPALVHRYATVLDTRAPKELEAIFSVGTPAEIMTYALYHLKKSWKEVGHPEFEDRILLNNDSASPFTSVMYAKQLLKQDWKSYGREDIHNAILNSKSARLYKETFPHLQTNDEKTAGEADKNKDRAQRKAALDAIGQRQAQQGQPAQ